MRQGFKGMINSPIFPFLQLIPNIQRVTRCTSVLMKTVSHARSYSRFIETTANFMDEPMFQFSKWQF